MGTPQITVPSHGPSPVPGDATPSSGVIHINFRHAAGFTVIGNHLTQHRGLSLAAIGLAAHIQSLPAGARIGIKRLAERFPESETRIAAALRELEAHGYLHRSRVRLADGRIVTRTVTYNQPGAAGRPVTTPRPRTAT
ncbi:helix-turn-helix domain-containing protein, partial [Streptomyces sp. CLV115]